MAGGHGEGQGRTESSQSLGAWTSTLYLKLATNHRQTGWARGAGAHPWHEAQHEAAKASCERRHPGFCLQMGADGPCPSSGCRGELKQSRVCYSTHSSIGVPAAQLCHITNPPAWSRSQVRDCQSVLQLLLSSSAS